MEKRCSIVRTIAWYVSAEYSCGLYKRSKKVDKINLQRFYETGNVVIQKAL